MTHPGPGTEGSEINKPVPALQEVTVCGSGDEEKTVSTNQHLIRVNKCCGCWGRPIERVLE